MRYSKIREMDVSNGEGLGISLFVQGCHFHCRGCFNPETWDFSGGKEWTNEIKDKFFELAGKPYITRISILGGEPLCNENVAEVNSIIKELRQLYPQKKIWIYTGYKLDDILSSGFLKEDENWETRMNTVLNASVLVDGQFQLENQDLFNEHIVWAGSTNQRVINIDNLIIGTIFEQAREI